MATIQIPASPQTMVVDTALLSSSVLMEEAKNVELPASRASTPVAAAASSTLNPKPSSPKASSLMARTRSSPRKFLRGLSASKGDNRQEQQPSFEAREDVKQEMTRDGGDDFHDGREPSELAQPSTLPPLVPRGPPLSARRARTDGDAARAAEEDLLVRGPSVRRMQTDATDRMISEADAALGLMSVLPEDEEDLGEGPSMSMMSAASNRSTRSNRSNRSNRSSASVSRPTLPTYATPSSASTVDLFLDDMTQTTDDFMNECASALAETPMAVAAPPLISPPLSAPVVKEESSPSPAANTDGVKEETVEKITTIETHAEPVAAKPVEEEATKNEDVKLTNDVMAEEALAEKIVEEKKAPSPAVLAEVVVEEPHDQPTKLTRMKKKFQKKSPLKETSSKKEDAVVEKQQVPPPKTDGIKEEKTPEPSSGPVAAKLIEEKDEKQEVVNKPTTVDVVVDEVPPATIVEEKKEMPSPVAAEEVKEQPTKLTRMKGLSLKKKFQKAKSPMLESPAPAKKVEDSAAEKEETSPKTAIKEETVEKIPIETKTEPVAAKLVEESAKKDDSKPTVVAVEEASAKIVEEEKEMPSPVAAEEVKEQPTKLARMKGLSLKKKFQKAKPPMQEPPAPAKKVEDSAAEKDETSPKTDAIKEENVEKSPSAPSLEPITAKPVDEKEVKKEGTKPTADLVVEEAPAENLEDKKERTHIAAEEPNDQSTQPNKKKGLSLKKKFLRAKLSSSPSLKESIPEKIEKKEIAVEKKEAVDAKSNDTPTVALEEASETVKPLPLAVMEEPSATSYEGEVAGENPAVTVEAADESTDTPTAAKPIAAEEKPTSDPTAAESIAIEEKPISDEVTVKLPAFQETLKLLEGEEKKSDSEKKEGSSWLSSIFASQSSSPVEQESRAEQEPAAQPTEPSSEKEHIPEPNAKSPTGEPTSEPSTESSPGLAEDKPIEDEPKLGAEDTASKPTAEDEKKDEAMPPIGISVDAMDQAYNNLDEQSESLVVAVVEETKKDEASAAAASKSTSKSRRTIKSISMKKLQMMTNKSTTNTTAASASPKSSINKVGMKAKKQAAKKGPASNNLMTKVKSIRTTTMKDDKGSVAKGSAKKVKTTLDVDEKSSKSNHSKYSFSSKSRRLSRMSIRKKQSLNDIPVMILSKSVESHEEPNKVVEVAKEEKHASTTTDETPAEPAEQAQVDSSSNIGDKKLNTEDALPTADESKIEEATNAVTAPVPVADESNIKEAKNAVTSQSRTASPTPSLNSVAKSVASAVDEATKAVGEAGEGVAGFVSGLMGFSKTAEEEAATETLAEEATTKPDNKAEPEEVGAQPEQPKSEEEPSKMEDDGADADAEPEQPKEDETSVGGNIELFANFDAIGSNLTSAKPRSAIGGSAQLDRSQGSFPVINLVKTDEKEAPAVNNVLEEASLNLTANKDPTPIEVETVMNEAAPISPNSAAKSPRIEVETIMNEAAPISPNGAAKSPRGKKMMGLSMKRLRMGKSKAHTVHSDNSTLTTSPSHELASQKSTKKKKGSLVNRARFRKTNKNKELPPPLSPPSSLTFPSNQKMPPLSEENVRADTFAAATGENLDGNDAKGLASGSFESTGKGLQTAKQAGKAKLESAMRDLREKQTAALAKREIARGLTDEKAVLEKELDAELKHLKMEKRKLKASYKEETRKSPEQELMLSVLQNQEYEAAKKKSEIAQARLEQAKAEQEAARFEAEALAARVEARRVLDELKEVKAKVQREQQAQKLEIQKMVHEQQLQQLQMQTDAATQMKEMQSQTQQWQMEQMKMQQMGQMEQMKMQQMQLQQQMQQSANINMPAVQQTQIVAAPEPSSRSQQAPHSIQYSAQLNSVDPENSHNLKSYRSELSNAAESSQPKGCGVDCSGGGIDVRCGDIGFEESVHGFLQWFMGSDEGKSSCGSSFFDCASEEVEEPKKIVKTKKQIKAAKKNKKGGK